MQPRYVLQRVLVAGLVLVVATPAVAESPTTVPDLALALDAAPVTIEATLEPGASLVGSIDITGRAINYGEVGLEIADGGGYLVRLSSSDGTWVTRGLGGASVSWSSETRGTGSRVDFRIDPMDHLSKPATLSITFTAVGLAQDFAEGAAITLEPGPVTMSTPATLKAVSERVLLDTSSAAARLILVWDIPPLDQQWELIWLGSQQRRGRADVPSPLERDPLASSSSPCALDEGCKGMTSPSFALSHGETSVDEFATAIFWSPEPVDTGDIEIAIDMAPSAVASGTVTLDAVQPDVMIPMELMFSGEQTLEMYPAISVTVLDGALFEPVDIAVDRLSGTRWWRPPPFRVIDHVQDRADYQFAIASRPAFRGTATVEVKWSVIAFAASEPDNGFTTFDAVGIRVGTPTRIEFGRDERGDPSRSLGTPLWVSAGAVLLLVGVAGSFLALLRRRGRKAADRASSS